MLGLDALTFLAVVPLALRLPALARDTDGRPRPSFVRDARDGLAFVWRTPYVLAVAGVLGWGGGARIVIWCRAAAWASALKSGGPAGGGGRVRARAGSPTSAANCSNPAGVCKVRNRAVAEVTT